MSITTQKYRNNCLQNHNKFKFKIKIIKVKVLMKLIKLSSDEFEQSFKHIKKNDKNSF